MKHYRYHYHCVTNVNDNFRYAPLMPTKQNMLFSVEGVEVMPNYMCNNMFCTVHLKNLSSASSGAYRCEISGDAPEFKLSHETSNLTAAGKKKKVQEEFKLSFSRCSIVGIS